MHHKLTHAARRLHRQSRQCFHSYSHRAGIKERCFSQVCEDKHNMPSLSVDTHSGLVWDTAGRLAADMFASFLRAESERDPET